MEEEEVDKTHGTDHSKSRNISMKKVGTGIDQHVFAIKYFVLIAGLQHFFFCTYIGTSVKKY